MLKPDDMATSDEVEADLDSRGIAWDYCLYCGQQFLEPAAHWPYCSPDCGLRAEEESEKDE